MKTFKTLLLSIFVISAIACKSNNNEENVDEANAADATYESYGESISSNGAVALNSAAQEMQTMKLGDTIPMKLTAEVSKVCQAKGCWMTLNTANGEEVMVKFKDYGFFVPKDISGKDVVINGNLFVEEVSVEDQRHLAKDEGKSQEEIASITAPKKSYGFLADGVLVSNE